MERDLHVVGERGASRRGLDTNGRPEVLTGHTFSSSPGSTYWITGNLLGVWLLKAIGEPTIARRHLLVGSSFPAGSRWRGGSSATRVFTPPGWHRTQLRRV